MKNSRSDHYNNNKVADSDPPRKQTFANLLHSDGLEKSFSFNRQPTPPSRSSFQCTPSPSPSYLSPSMGLSFSSSPASNSPWSAHIAPGSNSHARLIGSLIRKEGHVYSLASSGDMLYTGSESKIIRVWKNLNEFSGFKSNSGLVKAIIINGERIFSGHQDGKIRIWKVSHKDPALHKRVGTLPTFRAKFKSSFNPSNYVEVRRHHNAIWIKHTDPISCLALSEDKSLLYSASWDKTFKVWRVSDSKCLESVNAHDDAVNSIVTASEGVVCTGSADGTVKVWWRQMEEKRTKHFLSQTLLKQECAVTALAVDPSSRFLYCGSSDGIVNYWEIDKFLHHGGELKGHKLAVLCLATVGNLVLSGSADTNICVWRRDGAVHVCLTVLGGHSGPVKCLAVEEEEEEEKGGHWGDGDRQYTVYSGSIDKSVKIWKVSTQAAVLQALPLPEPHHQVENYESWQRLSTEVIAR